MFSAVRQGQNPKYGHTFRDEGYMGAAKGRMLKRTVSSDHSFIVLCTLPAVRQLLLGNAIVQNWR